MDHPCLDGGPRSNRNRCTKFNEGGRKEKKSGNVASGKGDILM